MRSGSVSWLILVFFASELALAMIKRSRHTSGTTGADRGSIVLLWVVITLAIAAARSLSEYPSGRLPFPTAWIQATAMTLLASGLLFRWWAVITLGKFFTVDVATHADHALIDTGPYALVRHPSYTGLLLAFFGFSLSLGNVFSVLAMMTPIVIALSYRMRVEEEALRQALGPKYDAYCEKTKRLIPGIV